MATTMIESFFQRSLEDMVKGLRVQMIGETAYLCKALEDVKKEIKSMDPSTKSVALQKLTYLNMLQGTDMNWAAFHIVEVMSVQKFFAKKIGYLAASQSFDEGTDVLLLITNLLRKDFGAKNEYETSLAIECLSRVASADLARDLTPELFTMLASGRPFVRKKATIALLRVFSQYPDAIRVAFKRLVERLNDADPSVVTAAVSVLCDLAVKDPKPYLPLAPELYKILVRCPNNWLCIKLVKICGVLAPLEPRLGKKIAEPLCELMRKSEATSLLLECIQTVTLGLTEHRGAVTLCAQKLKELLAQDDTNLKFLCLRALAKLMPWHPWAVAENKEVIVKCLSHRDSSIQKGALRLIIGMVSEDNVTETVHVLLQYAYNTDSVSCNEIVSVILSTCSSDHYALISDFSWYVSILAEMARIPRCECGDEIGRQLIDIGFRVKSATGDVLRAGRNLLLDPALLDHVAIQGLLSAAAWIAGEYVAFSHNPYELVEALLQPRTKFLPASVRALYLQAAFKIFVHSASRFFANEASSSRASTREDKTYLGKLPSGQDLSTIDDVRLKTPQELKPRDLKELSDFEVEERRKGKTLEDSWEPEQNQLEWRRIEATNNCQDPSESIREYEGNRTSEGGAQEEDATRDVQNGLTRSLAPTVQLMTENVTALVTSLDVEVQERACNLLGLLRVVKDRPTFPHPSQSDSPQALDFRDLLDALLEVLKVELHPVSAHAQGRVTAPEGLTLENLDALGPLQNNQDTEDGFIGREGLQEWEIGKLFSFQGKGSTAQADESAALLAQHRQRHQNYYLSAEGKSVSDSFGYPPPLMGHLDHAALFTGSVPFGDESLLSKSKPSRSKSRPVVVMLDDDEDNHLESSLKTKTKDLKDEFISSTIMNVLAGPPAGAHKSQIPTQGLDGGESGCVRQHRSRPNRSSRHSGKNVSFNSQTSLSVGDGSILENYASVAFENDDKPSNLSRRQDHVKSTSRHRPSRHERKALSSSPVDKEEQAALKSVQGSLGRAKSRQFGGHRAGSPGKKIRDGSIVLDFSS